MRLVTFEEAGRHKLGGLRGSDMVVDLARAAEMERAPQPAFGSMQALIDGGERCWDVARGLIEREYPEASAPLSEVRLLAPLQTPRRLRDCSLFLEHMERAMERVAWGLAAKEQDQKATYEALMASGRFDLKPIFKSQVIYYNADHLSVSGPDDELACPSYAQWLDYELEWACVVGRGGRDVPASKAREHIFGYTIFNDWSLRDIQMPIMEAMLGPGEGKDFPGGNGLGPCIVTPDEIGDPYGLTMIGRVNGEEWSRGSTATMHHSFEDALAQFSREKPLHPGEVIGSGTVLTGCGFELGRKLAPGDVVELEVQSIGVLRNRVAHR